MTKERFTFYKEFPKTCRPDDFWGQVKRTVGGVPVPQDQIDMIVYSVLEGLCICKEDILLDLCCGNGALTSLLFRHCQGGVGVDFSEYLIEIANRNFTKAPRETYVLKDVVDYCETSPTSHIFTKALCYGSFSYLESDRAERFLCLLRGNFPNLTHVYIGNCPDRDLLKEFVDKQVFELGSEDDPESPIGIWRTKEEFSDFTTSCGWMASFRKMPKTFYASHYRYDVVLTHAN